MAKAKTGTGKTVAFLVIHTFLFKIVVTLVKNYNCSTSKNKLETPEFRVKP